MIVCSCNVLTDHDVRNACQAAHKDRPRSTGQVYGCLGCSAQCGRCARTIHKIMTEALATACEAGCQAGCPHAASHALHRQDHGHLDQLAVDDAIFNQAIAAG